MNDFLRRLPSTNFRIFVGVCLAVVLVIYVLLAQTVQGLFGFGGCVATESGVSNCSPGLLLDREYVETLRNFVVIILAIDAAQFVGKRVTHKEGVGEGDDA